MADRPLSEHDEVLAGWVGDAVSTGSLTAGRDTRPAAVRSLPAVRFANRGSGRSKGQLGTEDRGQSHTHCRPGEPDDAVEAVVVGDREPVEAEASRLVDELLGVAGAVEEGEVGVAVQLGVARCHGDSTLSNIRSYGKMALHRKSPDEG